MDWSKTVAGRLATGDCTKNIHIWNPSQGTWLVDQRPLCGHTKSVEDIQWSPNEPSVSLLPSGCYKVCLVSFFSTLTSNKLPCVTEKKTHVWLTHVWLT